MIVRTIYYEGVGADGLKIFFVIKAVELTAENEFSATQNNSFLYDRRMFSQHTSAIKYLFVASKELYHLLKNKYSSYLNGVHMH